MQRKTIGNADEKKISFFFRSLLACVTMNQSLALKTVYLKILKWNFSQPALLQNQLRLEQTYLPDW